MYKRQLQGGVHGITGILPGNVSAVHLRDIGASPIVADTLFMIVLPIAGGHGNVVISQKAADMYIASATTRDVYKRQLLMKFPDQPEG